MAITLVGSASTTDTNGGTVTLTLPTAAQNDVVLFWGVTRDTGAASFITSGYTTLSDVDGRFLVGYKVMGATPDTQVKFDGGSGASITAVYVLRGVDTSNVTDATTVYASGTSTNPDCPSITTVHNGAWVFALARNTIDDTSITIPSGYTNSVAASLASPSRLSLAGGTLEKTTAGAENPASFTGWASGEWSAVTVAIRAAEVSYDLGPTTGNLALSSVAPQRAVSDDRSPALGNLVLSTTAPTADINVHVSFSPATANLALSGPASFLGSEYTPGVGNLVLSGSAAALDAPIDRAPAAANLALSTAAPALDTAPNLAPAAGNLVLSPTAPDRTVAEHAFLNPAGANLVLSGTAPSQSQDTIYLPTTGNLTLTTIKPGMVTLEDHSMEPDGGNLGIREHAPTISILRSRRTTTATSTITSRLRN